MKQRFNDKFLGRRASAKMENCGHANNEHKIKTCNGPGCSIR